MRRVFIRFNNLLTRLRRRRISGDNLLLLVPHCLQDSLCTQEIRRDINHCRRCGQCDVAGLLKIRDRYGLLCNLAGGGGQALACARRPEVKAVVAVACERELTAGILAAFPRPVLAVPNMRPHGPCRDTAVDLARVERAVLSLLAPAAPSA